MSNTPEKYDWVWSESLMQLSREKRELEYQRVKDLVRRMLLEDLRLLRARLADMLESRSTGFDELIALRGRIVDEEIQSRRPRWMPVWLSLTIVTDTKTRTKLIELLTTLPQKKLEQ